MASRVLQFESYAQKNRFPEDAVLAARQDGRAMAVAERLDSAENDGVRFVRGCIVAIGLELVAAMGLYGLWELQHLFR